MKGLEKKQERKGTSEMYTEFQTSPQTTLIKKLFSLSRKQKGQAAIFENNST
jgi:hypothetical protein